LESAVKKFIAMLVMGGVLLAGGIGCSGDKDKDKDKKDEKDKKKTSVLVIKHLA
jgi:hypothetical protein